MQVHTLTYFFNVSCWFFVVFCRRDSVGQLLSAHEAHNQYSLLIQSCFTSDSAGWLPDHHLLVLLLQHRQQQQHMLMQHHLSSKYDASISSDILTAASNAPATAVLIPGSTSTQVNVAATFGQKISPIWVYSTKLHWRFRPRDDP